MVKSRKDSSGVERGKCICYQWKEKGQSSKGDQCSFQHESNDRAQKPTPKAATLSELSMTRSRCALRKRVSEAKVTLVPFFDNRADIIWKVLVRDHLVSIGILPNVNSTNWIGMQSRGQVSIPASQGWRLTQQKHQKVTFLKKKRKRWQECCSYCENCTTIGLCLVRLRTVRTSEKREVSGKPDA